MPRTFTITIQDNDSQKTATLVIPAPVVAAMTEWRKTQTIQGPDPKWVAPNPVEWEKANPGIPAPTSAPTIDLPKFPGNRALLLQIIQDGRKFWVGAAENNAILA